MYLVFGMVCIVFLWNSVVRSLNLTQPLTPSLKNQRRGIDSTSKLEINTIIIGVRTVLVVRCSTKTGSRISAAVLGPFC